MDQSEKLDNFFEISKLIYHKEVDGIAIGGEILTEELRDVLRQEAQYFERSRLWEILNATIVNESAQIALNQSTTMEHVHTGKMLYYWAKTFRKMITELSK